MLYGSAEIMAMPWELVINSYAQHLGERRFDRIEQYAQEFLCFVEWATSLFPPDVQQAWFRELVGRYWKENLAGPLATKLKQGLNNSVGTANAILAKLLKEDHATWQKYPTIDQLGTAYGDKVISNIVQPWMNWKRSCSARTLEPGSPGWTSNLSEVYAHAAVVTPG